MTDSENRFAQILDVTGLLCPMPVLRTRRILDEMKTGTLLLVQASDPASVHDMPAFCKMAGHKLCMARTEKGRFLFEIEKGDRPPTDDTEAAPMRQPS
jgi:tRNA 2-thiouridine synthesizing protein A